MKGSSFGSTRNRLVRVAEGREDLVDGVEPAVVVRLEPHPADVAAEQDLAGVAQPVERVLVARGDLLVALEHRRRIAELRLDVGIVERQQPDRLRPVTVARARRAAASPATASRAAWPG